MGYAQSGKDTVANILVEEYGYTRVAFADKIREFLYEIDPGIPLTNGAQVAVVGLQNLVDEVGWDDAKQHPNVRALLQNTGVGARNLFGEKFWIAQALTNVHFTENVVITDVRFINEAESIKKYDNAQLWRVTRPGVNPVNLHISETELKDYKEDLSLDNRGTIEELELLVRSNMESLLSVN